MFTSHGKSDYWNGNSGLMAGAALLLLPKLRKGSKTMDELPTSATGYADAFLPPGDMRDEIMRIIRIGKPFREQHVGRKPGFLHGYICEVVANMKEPPTFANLLAELDLAATRRDSGDDSSPIERVSRSWEQLIYHRGPRSGEVQITFKTLRNYFTAAKQARNK